MKLSTNVKCLMCCRGRLVWRSRLRDSVLVLVEPVAFPLVHLGGEQSIEEGWPKTSPSSFSWS